MRQPPDLKTLLLQARWCLFEDEKAAGEEQVRLQPELARRAKLRRKIDHALNLTVITHTPSRGKGRG